MECPFQYFARGLNQPETMKILLVWPKAFEATQTFPLVYAYLIRRIDMSRHQVRLLDCALDDIPAASPRFREEISAFQPDLVGFSCWSFSVSEVRDGLQVVKEVCPEAVTVVGGVHVSLYPEVMRQIPQIDFIFRGEADEAFPRFMEALEKGSDDWDGIPGLGYRDGLGEPVLNPTREIASLDDIPAPDYVFAGLGRYLEAGYGFLTSSRRSAPILGTRGCPYHCEYCSVPIHHGTNHRRHSIAYLLALIEQLHRDFGVDYINIMDDNFTQDMDFAKRFCRALIKLDLPITFCASRGIRLDRTDDELFRLMRQSGFDSVTFAVESGSDPILHAMKKGVDTAPVLDKIHEARNVGLKIYLFFIYGWPDETRAEIRRTVRLLRACKPDYFLLFRFNPLPGTPIYRKLVERGEIPTGDGTIPYTFSRGYGNYTPPGLKHFNFRWVLFREYLRMFATRPATIRHFFRRNGIRNVLGVLSGRISYS